MQAMEKGYCELQKVDHVHQMTVDSWNNVVVQGMTCFHLLLVKDKVDAAPAVAEILQ